MAEELFSDLLSVEEAFGTDEASGVTTEQEVIDGLRKVSEARFETGDFHLGVASRPLTVPIKHSSYYLMRLPVLQ